MSSKHPRYQVFRLTDNSVRLLRSFGNIASLYRFVTARKSDHLAICQNYVLAYIVKRGKVIFLSE